MSETVEPQSPVSPAREGLDGGHLMIALRALLALIVAACLVGVVYRGSYDGVTVIGLIALALLLATYGVFTRGFWLRDADEDASRLDRLDGRRADAATRSPQERAA